MLSNAPLGSAICTNHIRAWPSESRSSVCGPMSCAAEDRPRSASLRRSSSNRASSRRAPMSAVLVTRNVHFLCGV
ncbi:Uncharacterised protein [Mycobacterium tuberculosis]|uniref:Uncharacterized protein n=1 Tax=Mycobacterium tuberculosis TaxID=1773 RepID=A0A0U0QYC1_MYCTX|nr:Uncharacterised protein [Mycobacterium tuberculosis]CKR34729.1 Uncharacterised protein [Mycobacterium tuberculosis]CKR62621.1 Uncharacterised protein [Mycobacterium tuberculosis]CKR81490.1 Uncharacterised protein [Mycobacterium tuberculosis]CKU33504.1 Uncharacterised protein [Mycobacterium tuberculosis]